MQIHSIAAVLLFGAAASALPQVAPYSAEAAADLSSTAALLSSGTISSLLEVITKYGLQDDFGVYSLHEHLNYTTGEAPYQMYANETFAVSSVVQYAGLSSFSVPTIYAVDFSTSELVPIEFAGKDVVTSAAQTWLAEAMSKGFVKDFIAALKSAPADEQSVAGLGLLTDLARSILGDADKAILVSASTSENVKVSSVVSMSSLEDAYTLVQRQSTIEPTLFAASNDTGGFQTLGWCLRCQCYFCW